MVSIRHVREKWLLLQTLTTQPLQESAQSSLKGWSQPADSIAECKPGRVGPLGVGGMELVDLHWWG